MTSSVVAVAALDADGDGSSNAESSSRAGGGGGASGVAEAPKPSTSVSNSSSSSNGVECLGTGVETTCLVVDREGEEDEEGNEKPSTSSPPSLSSSPLDSLLSTLLLISPFFFWGSSMAAMKLLEPHTTPLFVAAVRLLPAGAILVAWAASKNRPVPSGLAAWGPVAVFALVDGAMFQGFLAEGLRRTTAGLGSVIIDSQPLTVAALSALFYGEALTLLGILGLGVGIAGLCLLEVPPEKIFDAVPALGPLLLGSGAAGGGGGGGAAEAAAAAAAVATTAMASNPSSSSPSIWDSGELWMLLAAQSMAAGTLLVPWVSRRADPVMATGFHMILGGVPLLALALAGDEGALLSSKLSGVAPSDLGLLAYVSVLGSAASYGVFFYNAAAGNLTRLSSLTFLTPGFAVATGYVFLGETLTPLQLVGAGVTLASVVLISTKGKKREKEKGKENAS